MLLTNTISPLCSRFGLFRSIELNCEAGFRSLDINLCRTDSPLLEKNNAAALCRVQTLLSSYGAIAHQAHAPFPIGKDAYRIPAENVEELLYRSLEVSSALGVSQVVFHPLRIYGSTKQERIEKNCEVLRPYGEYAKKCGVKIAVENLFCQHPENPKKLIANACATGEELAATVDALGEPFVACLDLGHAGLAGQSAAEMIRALGKSRLHALHVHDNDYFTDQHLMPYQGEIDFDSILCALAEIDYDDSFTFEAVGKPLSKLPEELCVSALRYLFEMGTHFLQKIQEKKRALGK